MQVRLIRALRERHRISTKLFVKLSGVCRQRIVQIELGSQRPTEHMLGLVRKAVERVIEQRQNELAEVEDDFLRYQYNLLDYVNEEDLS
jgi:transcriptional regulator with XRE-family HTH domain